MKKCDNCNTENLDDAVKCFACQTAFECKKGNNFYTEPEQKKGLIDPLQVESNNLDTVPEEEFNESLKKGPAKKCPFCAEEIREEAIKCKHCGEMLQKKCPFCAELTTTTIGKCEHCNSDLDRKRASNSTPNVDTEKQRSPGIAAVLSFVLPGMGQIYNGQVGKGVVFFILFVALFWTVIIPIIIWFVAIFDAHSYATIKG